MCGTFLLVYVHLLSVIIPDTPSPYWRKGIGIFRCDHRPRPAHPVSLESATTFSHTRFSARVPNFGTVGEAPGVRRSMSGHTILLVEQNPITRQTMHLALETGGYRVLDATDGASASAGMRSRPDLVLLDLAMQDADAFQLVSRLRAVPGGDQVPIFACSGLVSSRDEARLCAMGFDDIVTKPIDPTNLIRMIRGYLPAGGEARDRFGQGRRVLVADDDPIQLKLMSHRLASHGFETIVAGDGEQALELAKKNLPECIVSDVMMPRLDGFGLCQRLREDPKLSDRPVVLVTNSYVERADRELAWRLGADDLVLRTPELREVVEVLRDCFQSSSPSRRALTAREGFSREIEEERNRRVINQLERQVALNSGLMQRVSILSAELSVVRGISSALVQGLDVDAAVDAVLTACLDAGGIERGALYLLEPNDRIKVRVFGGPDSATSELRAFFGRLDELRRIIAEKRTVHVGGALASPGVELRVPIEAGSSAILVPLVHRDEALGALLLIARVQSQDLDRTVFSEAVANQLALSLTLSKGFELRAESERRAKAQAALLTSILDSVADGIAAVDERGEFTHWNSAATPIIELRDAPGSQEDTASQEGLFQVDGVTRLSRSERPLLRALRGEVVGGEEIVMRRRGSHDGSWLSVNARPLRDETGAVRGAVAAFRDVTAERKAHAQLMVSDRMASIGMLAAGVAHEINNPLAAVLGNLELTAMYLADLEADLGPNEGLREIEVCLRDCRDGAERVRQIVRDLKIFSRGEDDKRVPVNVERVMESTLRMAKNEIHHRAELVKRYGGVPAVDANESRLGQVFLNLLMNAAQAIPEGKATAHQIRVTTRTDDRGDVVVEIADTGQGMPPEVVRKLFNPFFTTKAPGQGTGLGLTICQRIVSALGGEIEVESSVGKGTVLRVSLPPSSSHEVASARTADVRRPPRRGRVLVIDDEPMVGALVKRMLEVEHDVVVFDSAEEALRCLAEGATFDVIFCDVMMPVVGGVEFYDRLRLVAPALVERVVFLTGGAFTPSARDFLDRVSNARVEKPFEVQRVRHLVSERLRSIDDEQGKNHD